MLESQLSGQFWLRKIFVSPICSTFAVERAEIVRFLEYIQNLGFFLLNNDFFKNARGGKFAVESVSDYIISEKSLFLRNCEFLQKIKQNSNLEKWESLIKSIYNMEGNLSIVARVFLNFICQLHNSVNCTILHWKFMITLDCSKFAIELKWNSRISPKNTKLEFCSENKFFLK